MMSYPRFLIISIFVLIISSACAAVTTEDEGKDVADESLKHHTVDGFQNDPFIETAAPKGVLFYMRRIWGSVLTPSVPDGHVLTESESSQLLKSIEGDRVTWLGHASFLLKVSGITILTDPFLTEYASPVSWAGPTRFVKSAISLDKLPAIDIIIVSHNHYDHLDDQTVRSLKNKGRIEVVVPLGLKSFFIDRGYTKVSELDWRESVSLKGIEFVSLPAVHDSARSIGDHNKTLWASWAINGTSTKVFFSGDTGYSESIYKGIGNKYGPFQYAIIPIGAYEPRELMWMSHVTPEEAVAIGEDIQAKTLIASHWGTVSSLSDEPPFEPPQRFKSAGVNKGYPESALWVMKIGESRALSPPIGIY